LNVTSVRPKQLYSYNAHVSASIPDCFCAQFSPFDDAAPIPKRSFIHFVAVAAIGAQFKEIVYLTTVIAGFPKAIAASQTLSELFAERRAAPAGGQVP
jgi:hypothetical protein